MRRVRLMGLGLVASALLMALLAGGASAAAPRDVPAGSVELDASSYTAHENQGELTITIVRSGDLSVSEQIGYGVKQQDARNGIDFDVVPNNRITIPAGQATATFNVTIIDQGIDGTPVHALAYLYGAYPQPLGANANSLITILHDDPPEVRDPTNPLGVAGPVNGNLIAGTKLYVDPNSGAANAERRYAHSKRSWARALNILASEPDASRFYMYNMGSNVAGQVSHYLQDTQLADPGTTVMLSSYNLVHGPCGSTATPAFQARYDSYMSQVAQGIGNFHVIYFLEFDSLITTPCLSRAQLAIRLAELHDAVTALEADPHVLVYIDAGAADAVHAPTIARLLREAGVAQAQGFFLNSTHFDWTRTEIGYGEAISQMLGGAHFIINTGQNGKGPLRPRHRVGHGNEVLCNPPGRGLGPLSVQGDVAQQTGYPNLDGLLWFSNPGGSGGQCVPGAPPTGQFWPARAVMLARNWVDKVEGPRWNPRYTKRAVHGHSGRKHSGHHH
ncbi:MAG: glycoside hydrolase family 6 protein [Solirubrobacteraceae bacterium]